MAPAVPEKDKSSKSSLLPSLRLQSLDELLVGAVLKAGPTGTSGKPPGGFVRGSIFNRALIWTLPLAVQGNKEALSLQATSVNFRR